MQYRLGVEEKVNRMEGEDESSDDDLDITRAVRKGLGEDGTVSLEKYIQDVVGSATDGSQTDEDDPKKPTNRPRMHDHHRDGEKIAWSDDDDAEAAYNAFKSRKSLKRKRAAAETKKAKAAATKTKAASSSMVGRRKRGSDAVADVARPSLDKNDARATDSDSEGQLMDEALPEYLKNRKARFERARERLGEAGLKLPPRYDDVYFSDDERMASLQEKPVLPHLKPCAPYKDVPLPYSAGLVPAPIAQWLRDYQVQGVEFLHELFVWQKGGILGDDMGLGKTIQVIAFLTAAFGKTGDERDAKRMRKLRRAGGERWYPRALIVCPGGLMENWKAELRRWGWWQVYVYHGTPDVKEAALQAASKGRAEIMITTYTTYRMNKSAINTVDWDCVVADECHTIKGRHSEVTQAMNEINALCRIGLTGTAIQNNYEELWTLLNWTNLGKFGSLSSWKTCISHPLKIGQAHDATVAQLATARKTAKSLVENLLPQFFLRRAKALIADQLPKKSDRVVFCPLTDTQADAYENYINSDIVDHVRTSADPCPCSSGKKRGWCCHAEIPGRGKWQNHVFPCIVTLQKLANHLALMIPTGADSKEKQDKDLDNLQITMPHSWKDLYRQRDSILNYANQEFCGKWKILKRLLQLWHANGDKVLVFSHSVRLLKMLQMLFTATTAYTVAYLDGGMSYEERARTVDGFNADPSQFVFLISTRAGGVGLNITSANKVVVADPNWNPAYDLQAQDRAYRIGQTRDVDVFRLVSAGTIEEIVYARQVYKQQQANIGYNASSERRYFRGVQDRRGKPGEIFGLANLFAYRGGAVVLRDIVNETNVAESRAGVRVADLDVAAARDGGGGDDGGPLRGGDDEDAAMSKLAALITGAGDDDEPGRKRTAAAGGRKRTDAVQAILASAGVQYTHENSEVIGTSKIETRLSRRAVERAADADVIGEVVFERQSQGQAEGPKRGDAGREARHRPPEEVRKRQFCSMARTFGFADATEFALVVEGWTQEQRRNCLDTFYAIRREKVMAGSPRGGEPLSESDGGF